jgi:hypothetical protein
VPCAWVVATGAAATARRARVLMARRNMVISWFD